GHQEQQQQQLLPLYVLADQFLQSVRAPESTG
ncbi:hypothetical protein Gpo141_00010456, partial [Globisporangium polare]